MGQLADLEIHCCYGLREGQGGGYEVDHEGCPQLIKIGEREEHEGSCKFAWVECPVGRSLCGPVRRMQLEQHMDVCTMIPCPFADFGEAEGGRGEVGMGRGTYALRYFVLVLI